MLTVCLILLGDDIFTNLMLIQNYNKVVVLQRHYWHLKEYNYFCSRVLKQWKHKAN